MDALEAGIYPMDFVQRYFASFYCVACTLMGNRQIIHSLRDGVKHEICCIFDILCLEGFAASPQICRRIICLAT